MSAFTGPNIVEDGLVLMLDVANGESFRGEPTTNLLSQTSFGNWNLYNSAVVTPIATGFDSTLAYKIEDDSTTLYKGVSLGGIGVSASTTYTYSVWFVPDSTSTSRSHFRLWSGGAISLRINVDNGTVNIARNDLGGTSAVGVSSGISETVFYNGYNWYRAYVTFTTPANVTSVVPEFLVAHDNLSNSGNSSNVGHIIAWGPQLEQKSYATPFVNGTRGTTVATGGGWADLSGNSNHGELVNGPTYSSSNLGSLVFDGVDDVVNLGNPLSLRNGQFTVCFFYMPIQTVNYRGIMNGITPGGRFCIFEDSAGVIRVQYRDNSELSLANGGVWRVSTFPNSVLPNVWYFIHLIGNENTNSFLGGINTIQSTSTASSQFVEPDSFNWYLGRRSNNFSNCRISNFLVYNRALTATEVLQNYNATKGRFGQ